ncbi:hypothetical protein VC83_03122 [Pseudogymnoascus destructans]|uniref:CCHC-type domain-containing protein n=1 Tax=Pseudogymnoascus destructans TaxID=655981 RepID=A0A177AE10_9PEZI|nr:uncharacterized protein VC83_03127 [Pseudogymnoascus destructans]XP_024325326.1 uncharacterized protein VC83_03122 [Pseudogymnoascus destructans]OAF60040.1 hypothetical protein VC83_03127 [Pseudogymnoascus destructans]OAF60044.1 hypothetical protein VC83_03122 [Pseudogymnoascus destructans]
MRKMTSNIPQDNDGQPSRMSTRQTTAAATTAAPTDDIPDRMANLEIQMQEIKEMIANLAATQTRIPSTPQVDTVEVEERRTSPMRNTPETVQLPPLRNTRSPSIPRMYSEDPPNRYKKSTISEKITPLSDGIEHTFMQWSASIRDRLVVNEDHYPTDVSRRALIWGTTTGLAKKYLEPQYLSATHGFRSADEMMDLLGSYYLTGNETEQARNLFDDLQMGEKGHTNETFSEFKARFQSAAITGQVTESEWFRFTPAEPGRTQPPRPTRSPLVSFQRTPFTPTAPKPDITGRVRTAVPATSGNCFKCGKPGHFQDKCPLNPTVKEIDREAPEDEEQWEEAVAHQSDASLEENDEA